MEQPLDTDEREHALGVLRSLDRMRREKRDCDLLIKVQKEEIPVHRNVLRAQSDYFDAMFSHDTLERQSGVVEMKEMKFQPVKKCVEYFYTGKISTSEEECEELLDTATLMQVKPVCDKIAPFLRSCLSPKSFFNIKKIACRFDLENLNKACDVFALDKLDSIACDEEFNQLDFEYVSFLISSKKSPDPNCEEAKLAIVLHWINFDIESRQSHLIQMINLLDIGKFTSGTVKYLVEKEPIFYESAECMRILFLAGMRLSDITISTPQVKFHNPQQSNATLLFDLTSKVLQAYYPENDCWIQMQPLLDDMCDGVTFTSVVFENYLYVLMRNKKVYRTDFTKRTSAWAKMSDMEKEHGPALRAVAHGGYIYVTGKKCMEMYNVIADEWEDFDMHGIQCNGCELVQHNSAIFSIGGVDGRESLRPTNCYSPATQTWSSLSPMNARRYDAAATVLNGRIYVAGGYGEEKKDQRNMESYNFDTKTWEEFPAMGSARSCFGLTAVGGQLFAVGNHQKPVEIEVYCAKAGRWKVLVSKPDMKILARATIAAYLPVNF